MSQQQIIEAFTAARHDVLISRYLGAAAFILSVYDWAIVFADELELVGRSRRSLGKVLYYFGRTVTVIGLAMANFHLSDQRADLTRKFCVVFTYINPILQLLSLFASYWLLMLRLVALYQDKRSFIWIFYGTLFASYVAALGLLIRAQMYFSKAIVYAAPVGICATTGRAPTIAALFYAPLAFEVFLFSMTAYRAWIDYRSQSKTSASLPLLRVLYRDGVLFFIIMTSLRIWNIRIYAARPLTETYLGVYIMWGAITVLSSRVYLNLVHMARYGNEPDVSFSFPITSTSSRREISTPLGSSFPRVIGRGITGRTPTATIDEPDQYYSVYFQDRFPLDHTLDQIALTETCIIKKGPEAA